ncbi:hypothetical protein J2X61_001392 [Bacillus sp. 3255]|nr:hypothetical protein [Bacillus sp. 3255]
MKFERAFEIIMASQLASERNAPGGKGWKGGWGMEKRSF